MNEPEVGKATRVAGLFPVGSRVICPARYGMHGRVAGEMREVLFDDMVPPMAVNVSDLVAEPEPVGHGWKAGDMARISDVPIGNRWWTRVNSDRSHTYVWLKPGDVVALKRPSSTAGVWYIGNPNFSTDWDIAICEHDIEPIEEGPSQ